MDNFTDYIDTLARMSILKTKAAYTCAVHPDILIRSGNADAEQRAYTVAQNTLKYHDQTFLLEKITSAVLRELEYANATCRQCDRKLPDQ